MTTRQSVIIVDIIGEVVKAMQPNLSPMVVNYCFGRQIQILRKLQDLNDSISLKGSKYPLLALYQDFPERRGIGYYANVTIPRIVIACLTQSTDFPDKRYAVTFKPILYPVYYEFLHQLALHRSVNENDEDYIPHTKWDRPGTQPEDRDMNDYIDAIEINNLTINITQTKTC